MPIQIKCECGKALRVKDELAGKKVRCPGCSEILVAPPAKEDESTVPVLSVAPPRKTPPKPIFDDDDDEQTAVTEKPARTARAKSKYEDDDEDDRRPAKSKRRRDDDEDEDNDDRSYLRGKKRRASPDAPLPTSDGGIPASIGMGVLMMIGAIVWFVGGLAAGIIFYYPPILFIVGIAAVVKGALRK